MPRPVDVMVVKAWRAGTIKPISRESLLRANVREKDAPASANDAIAEIWPDGFRVDVGSFKPMEIHVIKTLGDKSKEVSFGAMYKLHESTASRGRLIDAIKSLRRLGFICEPRHNKFALTVSGQRAYKRVEGNG